MTLDHQCFYSWDNTKIIYRSWNPSPNTKGIILLLHRGHEHSARMTVMADFFAEQNYTVFAWDARGNGLSEGPRDDAESFSVFAKDLQCFVETITQETQRSTEDMLIIASSMGAVIATSWVHDYAPNIKGMILATPAFNIRLYVPFAIPMLKVARKLSLMPRVSSYVKSKVLTHDRAQQAIYNQDPLISSSISTDLLIDTYGDSPSSPEGPSSNDVQGDTSKLKKDESVALVKDVSSHLALLYIKDDDSENETKSNASLTNQGSGGTQMHEGSDSKLHQDTVTEGMESTNADGES